MNVIMKKVKRVFRKKKLRKLSEPKKYTTVKPNNEVRVVWDLDNEG